MNTAGRRSLGTRRWGKNLRSVQAAGCIIREGEEIEETEIWNTLK
jgi:hypothetical protein